MSECTHLIKTVDGLRLYYREWLADEPRGNLVFVHGFGEHSGRYHHTMARFVKAGFNCFAIDVRGHGRSDGRRGYCRRFADFFSDVDALADRARTRPGGTGPCFLVGHSHGGLISLLYAASRVHSFDGLVISAPLLRLKLAVPAWKTAAASLLSNIMPTLPMGNEIKSEELTHDPQMVAAHRVDTLCIDVATPRWYTEMLGAQAELVARVDELTLPVLMLQGTDDQLVDPEATRHLYHLLPSSEKRFESYDGFYHELFNEVERERVFGDVLEWVSAQLDRTERS